MGKLIYGPNKCLKASSYNLYESEFPEFYQTVGIVLILASQIDFLQFQNYVMKKALTVPFTTKPKLPHTHSTAGTHKRINK